MTDQGEKMNWKIELREGARMVQGNANETQVENLEKEEGVKEKTFIFDLIFIF